MPTTWENETIDAEAQVYLLRQQVAELREELNARDAQIARLQEMLERAETRRW